jgi:alpha-L-rhamnosidase
MLAYAPFCAVAENTLAAGPVELRVDELQLPLGIDDIAPRFSWQLHDSAQGARQTAYEIQVASSAKLLAAGKTDVWDSGKVMGSQSVNIPYAGPPLEASTRYYWRVKAWNAEGKLYPLSKHAWWETGLLRSSAWKSDWIGFETEEERAIRGANSYWIANPDAQELAREKSAEQNFAYRAIVALPKPVKSAALYATAETTISAWINGEPVMAAEHLTPSGFLPWRKFRHADVTGQLVKGANSIAIEAKHYGAQPQHASPMIATLVVEYVDGTWAAFGTETAWKTAIHAAAGWQQNSFDDTNWKNAVLRKVGGHSLGHRTRQSAAARVYPRKPGQVRTVVCDRVRRLRDLRQRPARGRRRAGAWLDRFPPDGPLSDVRRDPADEDWR